MSLNNPELQRAHQEELHEARSHGASPARRRFLYLMMGGLMSFAGAILAIPIVAGFIAPLIAAPRGVWRAVGAVDSFAVGNAVEVTFYNPAPLPWAGVSAKNAVWLRRDTKTSFSAFTIYCQHLGCGVRWEQSSNLFFCPCHGGVYYANGDVAAGPPPKPLPRFPTRIRGGQVEVFTEPNPYA